jgi:succinate dehydrogenase / fumarate reductase iron-sulfur subunit
MGEKWRITLQIYRQKVGSSPHYDSFTLDVDPDEYVLDAIERVWAFHDRSLTFAHACHHSVCGACGMVVNGTEKLTCITPIRSVTPDGGTIRVHPLRNFPIVSDLVVDMGDLYLRLEEVLSPQIRPVADTTLGEGIRPIKNGKYEDMERLIDCIECGLCISACPIAATTPSYLGPAVLAAAQQQDLNEMPELLALVDSADGVWRCHGVHECTEVCPSNVEPAWRIMDLRKQVVKQRFGRLFSRRSA